MTPASPDRVQGLKLEGFGSTRPHEFAIWFNNIPGAAIISGHIEGKSQSIKELAASVLVAAIGVSAKAVLHSDPTALLVATNQLVSAHDDLECLIHMAVATWDASEQIIVAATAGNTTISHNGFQVVAEQPAVGFGSSLTEAPVALELELEDSIKVYGSSPQHSYGVSAQRLIDI